MKRFTHYCAYFLVFILLFSACKTKKTTTTSPRPTAPSTQGPKGTSSTPEKKLPKIPVALQPLNYQMPEMPREFRGVWIATVANIDWPISGTDSYEKQKRDFLAILDYYKGLNFNAVIVQIRTPGDAF